MHLSLPLTWICLPSLCLTPLADQPRWQPANESSLRKDFVTSSSLELQSFSVYMGGREDTRDNLEVEVVSSHRVQVLDTYARDDAGVSSVLREFETIAKAVDATVIQGGEDASFESSGQHDLAGHKVLFERDGDDWSASFAEDDEDGDTDWLEGLTGEADLAGLLSGEEIAVGDSWEVDAQQFVALLRPAGVPTAWPTEIDGENDGEGPVFTPFICLRESAGEASGDVEVEWARTVEVDERKMAELQLTFELQLEREFIDDLMLVVEAVGGEGSLPPFNEATASGEWNGTGVLLWDLAAGLPHSLTCSGEASLLLNLSGEDQGPTGMMEMQAELDFSGEASIELTAERP